jgi:hypothetical protein
MKGADLTTLTVYQMAAIMAFNDLRAKAQANTKT